MKLRWFFAFVPAFLFSMCGPDDITKATIAYYDSEGAEAYAARTKSRDMSAHYAQFLAAIPKKNEALILDAGCGTGADAQYFLGQGHRVVAYDASESMVRYAMQLLKQPVLKIRFDEMGFKNAFDGFWAMASFLHADIEQFGHIVQLHMDSLVLGGVGYFSVLSTKDGTGQFFDEAGPEYSRGRRWLKLGREEIQAKVIDKLEGAEVISISDPVEDSVAGRVVDGKRIFWTEVMLRKVAPSQGAKFHKTQY